MERSYNRLLDGNKKYAISKKFEDPEYFKNLGKGQSPEYLWIGCSDSRVPANEITGTESGQIFVHRNIANLVVHTDLNLLSVVEYAVEVLHVKHIIVCGHYGCGGIRAAMSNTSYGYVDSWLCNIKEVYEKNKTELEAIKEPDKREDRLTELNVLQQVKNLAKTKTVQQAWEKRELQVHGWVYGINSGLITDLNSSIDALSELEPVYRFRINE